jgi:oligosaccharide repeat unit polymerase
MGYKAANSTLAVFLGLGLFLVLLVYSDALGTAVVLLVYALLLLVAHRLYNLFNWLDPVVMFVVSYTVFLGVGGAALRYFALALRPLTLVAILLGLAAFLIGALVADGWRSPAGRLRLPRLPKIEISFTRRENYWAWFIFLIGVGLLLTYYAVVGSIPFLSENAETVRVGAVGGLGSILIPGFAFLNVGAVVLVANSARRYSGRSLATAVVVLALATFLLLGVGYRMPAIRLLLSVFIVYHFIRYAHIPKRNLAILVVSLVFLLSLAGFYRLFGQFLQTPADVEFALRRAVYALFVRYIYVFGLVLDFFPGDHPYLYGNSYLLSLRTLLPGAQQHFGYWLVDKMGLVLSTPGPVDPTIVGEFYANFGWVGIILGMGGTGFLLRSLYHRLLASPIIRANQLILLTLIATSTIGIVASGLALVLLFDLLPVLIVFSGYCLGTRLKISPQAPWPQAGTAKS